MRVVAFMKALEELPPLESDPLSERVIRIIRGFYKRQGVWPSASEIRKRTGESAPTRVSPTVITEELIRLEAVGKVQRVWYESKRAPRFRIIG